MLRISDSFVDMNGNFALRPVPTGLDMLRAPRQQFELFNPSSINIYYEIGNNSMFFIVKSNA